MIETSPETDALNQVVLRMVHTLNRQETVHVLTLLRNAWQQGWEEHSREGSCTGVCCVFGDQTVPNPYQVMLDGYDAPDPQQEAPTPPGT